MNAPDVHNTRSESYRFERPGTVPLVFDGWLIGDASSWTEGKDRWSEVDVYLTTNDRWVVVITGRSEVEGEVDRVTITVCDTPLAVQDGARIPSTGVITLTATEALQAAADADPRLAVTLEERV